MAKKARVSRKNVGKDKPSRPGYRHWLQVPLIQL
jgi:hypothetical protein